MRELTFISKSGTLSKMVTLICRKTEQLSEVNFTMHRLCSLAYSRNTHSDLFVKEA